MMRSLARRARPSFRLKPSPARTRFMAARSGSGAIISPPHAIPSQQAQPIVGTNGRFIPPTLWNQFGGSIGAPIQKDKTFFSTDYQGSRQKNGGSLLTRVPTAGERAGDLSDLGVRIFNACNGSNLQ